MELIINCESEQAFLELADAQELWVLGHTNPELYLGVDIGRKRDLTVAWLFEKLGDVLWSRALVALKNAPFDAQKKAIKDLLDLGVRRCSIDQTQIGWMLTEELQKEYANVEGVIFTAQVKEKLAPLVKQRFENRLVRIPDNRDVRADINAVKRFVTPAGNVRFDAEHTEKGHADRFWALALAIEAASQPVSHLSDGVIVGTPRDAEWQPAAMPAEF
jgi:phage FluMu gp28-like protein